MSKHKPELVKSTPKPQATEPKVAAPVLTPDLIAQVRAAGSVEAAISILSPGKPKANPDATYELNTSCKEPLPQKRGASIKVVAVAVQMNRAFKVAEVVAALPDVKSAAYWTRKLVKTGHLVEVKH